MLVIDLVFCVGAIRDHREDDQTEMVLDQQSRLRLTLQPGADFPWAAVPQTQSHAEWLYPNLPAWCVLSRDRHVRRLVWLSQFPRYPFLSSMRCTPRTSLQPEV